MIDIFVLSFNRLSYLGVSKHAHLKSGSGWGVSCLSPALGKLFVHSLAALGDILSTSECQALFSTQ